jgi:hypothetical protein
MEMPMTEMGEAGIAELLKMTIIALEEAKIQKIHAFFEGLAMLLMEMRFLQLAIPSEEMGEKWQKKTVMMEIQIVEMDELLTELLKKIGYA